MVSQKSVEFRTDLTAVKAQAETPSCKYVSFVFSGENFMTASRCGVALTMACAVLAAPALAEEGGSLSLSLDALMVTGTRTETSVKDSPVSVTVIESDQIERAAAQAPADPAPPPPELAAAKPVQTVQGQTLEKQETAPPAPEPAPWQALPVVALVGAAFGAGVWRQSRRTALRHAA